MVGPDGNAPSSLAYRASALLLSYEPVAEDGGLAPQPAEPVHLFSKQRPRLGGFVLPLREIAQFGPRGRICTCVVPLRRRRPCLLGHAGKWRVRPELHRHCSAFEARLTVCCRRTRKNGPFTRTCTSISGFASPRPVCWTMKRKLVGEAGFAPARARAHEFLRLACIHSTIRRKIGCRGRIRTCISPLNRRPLDWLSYPAMVEVEGLAPPNGWV